MRVEHVVGSCSALARNINSVLERLEIAGNVLVDIKYASDDTSYSALVMYEKRKEN